MTFQLQIDNNPFQFHIIYIGMNALKHDAATRAKEDIGSIRHLLTSMSKRTGMLPTPTACAICRRNHARISLVLWVA